MLAAYSVIVIVKARAATPGLAQAVISTAAITYKDLSKWQLASLLAVEDPKFFEHNGADYRTPGAGITTITQGIAKRFYFKPFKPGLAKYKLVLVSVFALNPLVSKNDQLTILLNAAYLGGAGAEILGFEKAAQYYYNKKFAELSEDQYLALVAMLISPVAFNVKTQPQANRERVARIKKVLSGEYKPLNLMDLYYGQLPPETVKAGLPPASYFPAMYK